ncbi:nucleoside deaminase [Bradyrhizobium sp. 200]|uniref:nucleoside deaminase n=1 Tax=Bradyrhizobium sp. 200 TaxID=2782665 RepID=UPI001FFEAE0E|nr:nucleoside deaminase [Bradyrhizobium sp. 200]
MKKLKPRCSTSSALRLLTARINWGMLCHVNHHDAQVSDLQLMRRCIALAKSVRPDGEYPFAAVVGRYGEFVCEASNMVRRASDVTRHAEMVALSAAQQLLRTRSLDDCTLYSTVEPCAMCAYAIRESRIGRVIFGLQSPFMGGHSRWDILRDTTLSSVMPEVFAPPPYVLAGCLCREVRKLFRSQHPLAWRVIECRRIFVEQADAIGMAAANAEPTLQWKQRFASWARSRIFDRLWRA